MLTSTRSSRVWSGPTSTITVRPVVTVSPTTLTIDVAETVDRERESARLELLVEDAHRVAIADRAVGQPHEHRIAIVDHADRFDLPRRQRIQHDDADQRDDRRIEHRARADDLVLRGFAALAGARC